MGAEESTNSNSQGARVRSLDSAREKPARDSVFANGQDQPSFIMANPHDQDPLMSTGKLSGIKKQRAQSKNRKQAEMGFWEGLCMGDGGVSGQNSSKLATYVKNKKGSVGEQHDLTMSLSKEDIMHSVHLSSKLKATALHDISHMSLLSATTNSVSQASWNHERLTEFEDPSLENYLQPHEIDFVKHPEALTTSKFALMCDQQIEDSTFRSISDKSKASENVKIFMKNNSSLNQDIAVIKVELRFDPQFSLQQVMRAIQNDKFRKRWDPFLQESRVFYRSQTNRLNMSYSKWESFLDQPSRHFYEKKLHFGVKREFSFREQRSSKSSMAERDDNIYYTYSSSCEETPKVPGLKNFTPFSPINEERKNKQAQEEASVEAKTIFSFHKFEQVEDYVPEKAKSSAATPGDDPDAYETQTQVLVTIISQTDLGGDQLNSKVYKGMLKSMAENQLKKNVKEFYNRWVSWMQMHSSSTASSGYSAVHRQGSAVEMGNGIELDQPY